MPIMWRRALIMCAEEKTRGFLGVIGCSKGGRAIVRADLGPVRPSSV
jgi:hypothetical protein